MEGSNQKVMAIIKTALLSFPIIDGLIQGDTIIIESGLIFMSPVCALLVFFMLNERFIAWRRNKKWKANEKTPASEQK